MATARHSVVAIDLDGCGLDYRRRAMRGLHHIAHLHNLPALIAPATLALLPGTHPGAWHQFVAWHGLADPYPDEDWDELGREWRAAAWTRVDTDIPTPGLGRFVQTVRRDGATVLFLTGRTERFRADSETTLARHGLHEVPVYMTDTSDDQVAATKSRILRDLATAESVMLIDDDMRNLTALGDLLPSATRIAMCLPHLTADPAIPADVPCVSSFYRSRIRTTPERVMAR